ncbi:hypothetical protein GKODMF_12385 [Candidatus Electrothrix gigas]
MPSKDPLDIFVSYARNDLLIFKEFKKHFSFAEKIKCVTVWHDNKIHAGQRWEKEIRSRLKCSPIILLLISPDFFSSEWCTKEAKIALEREEKKEALVIPVLLRYVSKIELKLSGLEKLNFALDHSSPLVDKNKNVDDERCGIAAEHIINAIENLLPNQR